MRKILAIAIVLLSFSSKAQITLGMGPIGVHQDTVLSGSSDTYSVWVKNTSFFSFADNLKVYTAVMDSLGGSVVDTVNVYNSAGIDSIPAGDSLQIPLTALYNVSPTGYKYGIDVIVVWPVAMSAITSDSLIFTVYIIDDSGTHTIDLDNLIHAYPNPATDHVIIGNSGPQSIKEIRLFDLSGKLVMDRENETCIDMEELAPGYYNADIHLSDNKHVFIKIIKQKN
jgi:hypothetical protein